MPQNIGGCFFLPERKKAAQQIAAPQGEISPESGRHGPEW